MQQLLAELLFHLRRRRRRERDDCWFLLLWTPIFFSSHFYFSSTDPEQKGHRRLQREWRKYIPSVWLYFGLLQIQAKIPLYQDSALLQLPRNSTAFCAELEEPTMAEINGPRHIWILANLNRHWFSDRLPEICNVCKSFSAWAKFHSHYLLFHRTKETENSH